MKKNDAFYLSLLVLIVGFNLGLTGCAPPERENPSGLKNNLALTPPMGWDSWNHFGLQISDSLMRQVADAMVVNGMREAGYQYLIMDEGWCLQKRIDGHLEPNPVLFPAGLRSLADYIHSRGLKFGLYADRGRLTCGGTGAGSYGYETVDAADFAAWGVDYLKYDNCSPAFFSNQQNDYRHMREALAVTQRPIVYAICAWGFKDWMPGAGNLWRTTIDMKDDWTTMMTILNANNQWAPYAGPGHWNDPDMLEIGNGTLDEKGPSLQGIPHEGMTNTEYKTQFSLWAVMAAPLIAGNDVRNMTLDTQEVLLNKEVIAVDQDPLGRQGTVVWSGPSGLEVYSKPLAQPGSRAVVLFNSSATGSEMTVHWKDAGLGPGESSVRDLWAHKYLGLFKESYSAYVPSHGVVMLKIVPWSR